MDNIPELSVRHLRAIATLAHFESFVAAATYLKISQSGLTRLIQQAEKLIGVQLFHRGTRKVMQTDAGEVIVEWRGLLLETSRSDAKEAAKAQATNRDSKLIG